MAIIMEKSMERAKMGPESYFITTAMFMKVFFFLYSGAWISDHKNGNGF